MKRRGCPSVYRTVGGRAIDLGKLTPAERSFLAYIYSVYRRSVEWTQFAKIWLLEFQRRKLPSGLADRICQDLEGRLGIAQGKVAPPDYRDYLADLIDEKYGSCYKFCKATGIDPGQLSRVFASRSDLSLEALGRIFPLLGVTLVVQPVETVKANISPEAARRALAGVA